MTKEEMQIAIAEDQGIQTEGWWCPKCEREIASGGAAFDETHDKRSEGCGTPLESMPIPELTMDWMHEIVNALDENKRLLWLMTMEIITSKCSDDWFPSRLIKATVEQWAEGYCRVKGLWK